MKAANQLRGLSGSFALSKSRLSSELCPNISPFVFVGLVGKPRVSLCQGVILSGCGVGRGLESLCPKLSRYLAVSTGGIHRGRNATQDVSSDTSIILPSSERSRRMSVFKQSLVPPLLGVRGAQHGRGGYAESQVPKPLFVDTISMRLGGCDAQSSPGWPRQEPPPGPFLFNAQAS